jgi:hypothetical protein
MQLLDTLNNLWSSLYLSYDSLFQGIDWASSFSQPGSGWLTRGSGYSSNSSGLKTDMENAHVEIPTSNTLNRKLNIVISTIYHRRIKKKIYMFILLYIRNAFGPSHPFLGIQWYQYTTTESSPHQRPFPDLGLISCLFMLSRLCKPEPSLSGSDIPSLEPELSQRPNSGFPVTPPLGHVNHT